MKGFCIHHNQGSRLPNLDLSTKLSTLFQIEFDITLCFKDVLSFKSYELILKCEMGGILSNIKIDVYMKIECYTVDLAVNVYFFIMILNQRMYEN